MFEIGTKVNLHFAGIEVPALIDSPITTAPVTLQSGKTIMAMTVLALSLRETNPDGDNPGHTYLTITPENVRFMTLRYEDVVGLDVDEEGKPLTRKALEQRRAADIVARQAATVKAQNPVQTRATVLFDALAEAIGPATEPTAS